MERKAAGRRTQEAAEASFEGRTHGIFTYWGCRFIRDNVEAVGQGGYTRTHPLDELRSYFLSLGYRQTPELAAPDEPRSGPPFRPGAWVEATGAGRPRRPWHAPPRRPGA
jgi:hypothetical protein